MLSLLFEMYSSYCIGNFFHFSLCFFLFSFSDDQVGRGSPVGLRAGSLWGSGGVTTTADMEQPTASRFRPDPIGRPKARQFNDPRTILHRPLPLPTRQHFRIPGKNSCNLFLFLFDLKQKKILRDIIIFLNWLAILHEMIDKDALVGHFD